MVTQNSSNQDYTNNADGFSLSGGNTRRKITVTGSDVSLAGGSMDSYSFPASGGTLATMQIVYPVGSIYMNASDGTNPATLLGFGTWVAFGPGRALAGFNGNDADFNASEKTGGSKIVVLRATIGAYDSNPSKIGYETQAAAVSRGFMYGGGLNAAESNIANSRINHSTWVGDPATGNDASVVQPYTTVYMWKRTA